MLNVIRVRNEVLGRFNQLRKLHNPTDFVTKLLDMYEESLKAENELKSASMELTELVEDKPAEEPIKIDEPIVDEPNVDESTKDVKPKKSSTKKKTTKKAVDKEN